MTTLLRKRKDTDTDSSERVTRHPEEGNRQEQVIYVKSRRPNGHAVADRMHDRLVERIDRQRDSKKRAPCIRGFRRKCTD